VGSIYVLSNPRTGEVRYNVCHVLKGRLASTGGFSFKRLEVPDA
jgi:hypothetical protein